MVFSPSAHFFFFFFNDTATTEIYTLSLHDALPICGMRQFTGGSEGTGTGRADHHRHLGHLDSCRSEEHTSELQSRLHLVCRLLLEKKKTKKYTKYDRLQKTQRIKDGDITLVATLLP